MSYAKKGKDLMATNIKRRLVIPQTWQMDDQLRFDQGFPDMNRRESMMMQSIQELRTGESHYADTKPIQLLWGIVPVEYTLNGTQDLLQTDKQNLQSNQQDLEGLKQSQEAQQAARGDA